MATWDPISPARAISKRNHAPARAMRWRELPPKFAATINDDSMGPCFVAGQQVVFDTTKAPRDGDGVLVADDAGGTYLRIFRDTHDGFFEALPLNHDFSMSTFDSKTDADFRVVGVVVNVISSAAFFYSPTGDAHCESMRLLEIARAWRKAYHEAIAEGRSYSSLDCYGHLGRRARGVPQ